MCSMCVLFVFHVQTASAAVRWISDSAGEAVGLKGSRIVLTGERGVYVPVVVFCVVDIQQFSRVPCFYLATMLAL